MVFNLNVFVNVESAGLHVMGTHFLLVMKMTLLVKTQYKRVLTVQLFLFFYCTN